MEKIKVLGKHISDKIAAGEVVERPASVIKELLENAVDAGASTICVEIKNGGISYMRVTDNGCGMSRKDTETCILRHATSKISTEDDLNKIVTLGFRGEALSSIAAVSKLEIYTKSKDEDMGTHLVAQNGEVLEVADAGCPDGTTMVVRELFCTVPARMKFLKKDSTEAGYIEDIVARLCLSRPEISIKFINNGKELIFTPGDNQISSAIYAVYGKDIKNAMIEANFEHAGVRVFGMCGKASTARPNRNMENFFVNGRFIKSPMLARAVEEAYKNELMTGKFPTCVLNISLSPEQVDINIHPTKLEAKFADDKNVYHCVYWAVKNALYSAAFVPEVSEHKSIKPQYVAPQTVRKEIYQMKQKAPKVSVPEEPKQMVQQKMTMFESGAKKASTKPEEPKKEIPFETFIPAVDENPAVHKTEEPRVSFAPIETKKAEEENFAPVLEEPVKTAPKEIVPEVTETKEAPVYKICGQVFHTYIIVEKDGKMLMVDQHAAHERLRYEKLLRQYKAREVVSQIMLAPEVVTLTSAEFSCFLENIETLESLGFQAEEFGSREIIVRTTPMEAGECNVKDTVLEILGMLSEGRKRIDDELSSKMLYSIACKGAVKANAALSQEEMKHLLDEIFSLEGINTCPHGRPITIEFTKDFIEKQFKRIV